MPEYYYSDPDFSMNAPVREKKEKLNLWLHGSLLLITFITTTIAGMEWTTGTTGPYELDHLITGLPYSLSILFILGCHEFGHYFAARYHRVRATLPYFIPLPSFFGLFLNFGTMGAVIKTKSPVRNNKAMFDIGVSGPISGFIACLLVLAYGFTHLPGKEYILGIHPDYFTSGYNSHGMALIFGDNLLFSFMKYLLTDPSAQFIPPMSEIYHYPYLCVGWFGLFVTAMNMIPVGQLDGGHIVFSMFGSKIHYIVARISLGVLIVTGIIGSIETYYGFLSGYGWTGWLIWAAILIFVIKIKHPPVYEFYRLDKKRVLLGYFSLFILVISFTPAPFIISVIP